MSHARHQVSCILPARNEAASLAATVAAWAAALPRCTSDHEIIVVDDGSTDESRSVLDALAARHPQLRVITHPRNLGYGVAITNGFTQAAFPLLFFTDADGQYEPEDLGLLLERIDTADVVVGYRFSRAEVGLRRLLSRGYNVLARHMVGVSLRDINCAFKLIRRTAFESLAVEATGFSFNAELAASAERAAMHVVEVPVRHLPRRAGRSSVRPFHVVSSLYELARLRIRQHRAPERPPASLGTSPWRGVPSGTSGS